MVSEPFPAMAPETRRWDSRSAMEAALQLSLLCTAALIVMPCSHTVTTIDGLQGSFMPPTILFTPSPTPQYQQDHSRFSYTARFALIFSHLCFQELATAAPSCSDSTYDAASFSTDPSTIFAPSDESLRTYYSCSVTNLHEHIVPGHFTMNYLQKLAFGTKIDSLSPGGCITVKSDSHNVQTAIVRLMIREAIIRLHDNGFSTLALATKVRYSELTTLNNRMIFAVDDLSIFPDSHSYTSSVRLHRVPNHYSTLPIGTTLLVAMEKYVANHETQAIQFDIGDLINYNYLDEEFFRRMTIESDFLNKNSVTADDDLEEALDHAIFKETSFSPITAATSPSPRDEFIYIVRLAEQHYDAMLNLIDLQYSVILASDDFAVIRLCQGGSAVAILTRVVDKTQWSLAKEKNTIKVDDSHYFFSFFFPDQNDEGDVCQRGIASYVLSYGLTISSKGGEALLKGLDAILEKYSNFSVPEVYETWKTGLEERGGIEYVKMPDVHTFLQHLVTFRIIKTDLDLYGKLVIGSAWSKQMPKLAVSFGLDDEMPDLIGGLISKGQQLDAVHFTYKGGLVDKLPPVPLLKEFLKDAKKVAASVLEDPNNAGRAAYLAARKEQSAFSAVIKCLEEYKLENELHPENRKKRLAQLETVKIAKKKPVAVPANESTQASNNGGGPMPPAKAGRLTNAHVSSFSTAPTFARSPSHGQYPAALPPYPSSPCC